MPLSSDSDSDSDDDVLPSRARRYTSAKAKLPATTARSDDATAVATTVANSTSVPKAAPRHVDRSGSGSDSDSDSDSDGRAQTTFGSRMRKTEANAERAKKRLEARRGNSMFAKGQRRRNFASGKFATSKKPNRFDLDD
jgi:hypothetical protein